MERPREVDYAEPQLHSAQSHPGLETRPSDDGPETALPNPAGLEALPGPGLILSQDDEKIMKQEPIQIVHQRRRYCVLPRRTWWILIVALLLAVVIIAVGAGVGASKHAANTNKSTSDNPTPAQKFTPASSPSMSPKALPGSLTTLSGSVTQTSGVSLPSATVYALSGCQNGTIYNSTHNILFEEYCDHDFRVGSHYNTTAADWAQMDVSTFQGCMDTCALDSSQKMHTKHMVGTCLSVTWVSGNGRCWMKNMTAVPSNADRTAQMTHARPQAHAGLQSANIVGDF